MYLFVSNDYMYRILRFIYLTLNDHGYCPQVQHGYTFKSLNSNSTLYFGQYSVPVPAINILITLCSLLYFSKSWGRYRRHDLFFFPSLLSLRTDVSCKKMTLLQFISI